MEVKNLPQTAASWAMTSANLHKTTEVTQSSYIQVTFNTERRDVVTKSENQVKFGAFFFKVMQKKKRELWIWFQSYVQTEN